MKKVNGHSENHQEEFLKRLKKDFPEVFTEDNKVDPEKLKATLGEDVEFARERYGLSWAGKSDCFREIQKTTTATLKPQKEESVDFDETENIFIEGENLEVLRVFQKSYYKKVKMIYIDPPYNTGNDFVYNDKFKQDKAEYQEQIGEKDGNGDLTKDTALRKNTKDSGHYHSNWLNMMYPRLFLARNLLKEDGVIFVSIDDHEVHNLRMIMNEIFGEENFEAQITWRRRHNQPNDKSKMIGKVAEYLIVYAKDSKTLKENRSFYGLPLSEERKEAYSNQDNDPRGPWATKPWKAGTNQDGSKYKIITPTGKVYEEVWLGSKETFEELKEDNRIYFPEGGAGYPRKKYFLGEREEEGQMAHNFWEHGDFGSNQEASSELENLFDGKSLFENPKPVRLIKNILRISVSKDDLILDYFAGSATTAHAVMDLNKEDGGNRKYIMVQLAESTDVESEAYKQGYKNIAEIAKERIRRAGKKLSEEEKQLELEDNGKHKLDIGFKAFKLSESNFPEWNTAVNDPEELEKQLEVFAQNGELASDSLSIIYELLLKSGYDLNSGIQLKKMNGNQTYLINDGKLIICLEEEVNKKLVDQIISSEPEKVIFLESCFEKDDQLKTNTLLQMESADIDFRVV